MSARPTTAVTAQERQAMLLLGAALLMFLIPQYGPVRYLILVLPVWSLVVLGGLPWRRLASCRVPVALVLFLLWCAASFLWSADRASTATGLVELGVYASVAVTAGWLLRLEELHRVVSFVVKLVLVATVAALLIAPGWSTTPPVDDPAPGWHSIFSHKNGLGAFLVLATVTVLFDATRRRWPWLLICTVLLIGAQSATALGVVLLLCATALWQRLAPAFREGPRAAYEFVSGGLLAIATLIIVVRPDWVAFALGRDATLTGRTEVWGAVRRQIAAHPWTGLGWDGVWTPASAPTQQIWREARFEAFYAHSGYLDVLLQIGIVGALLFMGFVATAVVQLARVRDSRAGLWALLVVLGLLLTALSESAAFTGAPGLPLLMLLNVAAARRLGRRRDIPRRPVHENAGSTSPQLIART